MDKCNCGFHSYARFSIAPITMVSKHLLLLLHTLVYSFLGRIIQNKYIEDPWAWPCNVCSDLGQVHISKETICLFTTPWLLSFLSWWYLMGRAFSCAVVQQLSQWQHTAGQNMTAGQGGDQKWDPQLCVKPGLSIWSYWFLWDLWTLGSCPWLCNMPDKFPSRMWSAGDNSSCEKASTLLKGCKP